MSESLTFDIGDAEPENIVMLTDYTDGSDDSSPVWSKTYTPREWKGYKDGGKVYLQWDELVRRWGPLTTAHLEWPKPSE